MMQSRGLDWMCVFFCRRIKGLGSLNCNSSSRKHQAPQTESTDVETTSSTESTVESTDVERFLLGVRNHAHSRHTEKNALCRAEKDLEVKNLVPSPELGVSSLWRISLPYFRVSRFEDRTTDWFIAVVWQVLIQPGTCWASPAVVGLLTGQLSGFSLKSGGWGRSWLSWKFTIFILWLPVCLPPRESMSVFLPGSLSTFWFLTKDSADKNTLGLLIAICPFTLSKACRLKIH